MLIGRRACRCPCKLATSGRPPALLLLNMLLVSLLWMLVLRGLSPLRRLRLRRLLLLRPALLLALRRPALGWAALTAGAGS